MKRYTSLTFTGTGVRALLASGDFQSLWILPAFEPVVIQFFVIVKPVT
jgi:hypothetical protein